MKIYELCRLCGLKNLKESMTCLDNAQIKNQVMKEKIIHCLRIQITNNDELPQTICVACADKVEDFYNFDFNAQKVQTKLFSNLLLAMVGDSTPDTDHLSSDSLHIIKNTPSSNEEWRRYEWKCSDCPGIFVAMDDLRRHYFNYHNKPTVYCCNNCLKPYKKFRSFYKHRKVCNNKKQKRDIKTCDKYDENNNRKEYMCVKCDKRFNRVNLLHIHMRTHDIVEKETQKIFPVSPIENKRNQLIYQKKIDADSNGKRNNSNIRSPSKIPRYKNISIKSYDCDNCGIKYYTKKNYDLHLKGGHVEEKCMFSCKLCNEQFEQERNLEDHYQEHFHKSPFSCHKCHYVFSYFSNFNKHLQTEHGLNIFWAEGKYSLE